MLVRWQFEDPVSLDTYTFPINPNAGGSPSYTKKFNYSSTSAPDGKTIIFEGLDEPQKFEFSGDILDQAHYDAFVLWWDKRYQVKVTDDLGRHFIIVIESFEPTRVRNATTPWKHTFSVKATILDWP